MATPEALLDQIFNEDSEPVPREVWQQQQLLRQQHVLQQQLLMLQQQQLLLHWRQQQQHKQHMKEEPLDEHDAYRQDSRKQRPTITSNIFGQAPLGVMGNVMHTEPAFDFRNRVHDFGSADLSGRGPMEWQNRSGSAQKTKSGKCESTLPHQHGSSAPMHYLPSVDELGMNSVDELGMNSESSTAISRLQLRQSVIEVAAFLREIRSQAPDPDMAITARKPDPREHVNCEFARRTSSATPYPIASKFEENSNVGICMIFPQGFESKNMMIDLEQFFKRCPINDRITSLRWADNIRGVPRKKAAKQSPDDGRSTMRFNHCCFVSLTLPGGNHHISVKVFKSGRLQTAGCINGEMSLQACRVIGSCLQQIAADGCTDTVVKGDVPAELLHQLANEASYNVWLEKQSIMGVFDLGFKAQGFTVDMDELRMLLVHPDNADRVARVHLPKADKEKVKRFQGLGVYVNKACLSYGSTDVYCNIFPTGKCTVTAASSVDQATEVAEVVSKLIIDLFLQCRKRSVAPSKSRRRR